MRRRLTPPALLAALLAIALAGCGGKSASSPLDDALGYLPKDAPLVASVDTDVGDSQFKALDKIVRRFPFGDPLVGSIKQSLGGKLGLDFERDVRPLLGNPLIVAAPDARALNDSVGDNDVIAILETKDADKLRQVAEKAGTKIGEKNGATLYRDRNGDVTAVKDKVAIGGSRGQIGKALEQRDKGDRLRQGDFQKALVGLPKKGLVRAEGNLRALLESDPSAAQARKVKWVGALRSFGATGVVKQKEIAIDFDVKTDPGSLTAADLPIASGDGAPKVVERPGEISFALRDPRQVIQFAQQAAQATSPASFGQYEQAKSQIEKQLGVSIDDDLFGQLSGDLSVSTSVGGKFGARAELKDPAAFKRTLAKVAKLLPRVAEGAGFGKVALARPKRGGDFYALAQAGAGSVVFGVVGDVLVVSNDPARAGRLAAVSPAPVPGAKGAIVLDADAEKVADAALRQLGPRLGLGGALGGRLLTAPLGRLTGSLAAGKSGLHGSLKLGFD